MQEIGSWEDLVEALSQWRWADAHPVEGGTLYRTSMPLDEGLGDSNWQMSDWYFDVPDWIQHDVLLAMNWESHGAPVSWDGFLEVIQVGEDVAYVTYFAEGVYDFPAVLGKVVPPQTPAAYRALFLELMRSDENFRVVPDHIRNGRPDLLDRATVRQGFWEMLERVADEPGVGWDDLPMRLGDAPSPLKTHLSEADRQALLDRYFDECYEEAGHE